MKKERKKEKTTNLLIRSEGRSSWSKRHRSRYAAELISTQYFPGVKPDSMTPPPLIKICLAIEFILRLYRMWGFKSLNIGCIILSWRWAAMINGSVQACVLNLHRYFEYKLKHWTRVKSISIYYKIYLSILTNGWQVGGPQHHWNIHVPLRVATTNCWLHQ